MLKLQFHIHDGSIVEEKQLAGNDLDSAMAYGRQLLSDGVLALSSPVPEPIIGFAVRNGIGELLRQWPESVPHA